MLLKDSIKFKVDFTNKLAKHALMSCFIARNVYVL